MVDLMSNKPHLPCLEGVVRGIANSDRLVELWWLHCLETVPVWVVIMVQ